MTLPRPVVLIGLPGAGKTTVAPLAAALLECGWCDIDQRIEARTGLPITTIFREQGEPRFRALEHDEMLAALGEPPQVIAPGAGWAAMPDQLAAIQGRALVIYLSVTPLQAATRLGAGGDRPLLSGTMVEQRLTELLTMRESWYRLADLEIAAGDVAPEALGAGIATAARQYGGW